MKYDDPQIRAQVLEAVKTGFGLMIASIDFVPFGEESYAYTISTADGTRFFVKYCVQPATVDNIDRTNRLLLELKQFPFIVAPVEHNDQVTVDVLTGKVSVYPYVEGEVIDLANELFDRKLVTEITGIITSLHTFIPTVDVPEETFVRNFSDQFSSLMVHSGDFSDDVKRLLLERKGEICILMDRFNKIGEVYKHDWPQLVLTHGDITGLNMIRSSSGVMLVDWDDVLLAPKERDLIFLHNNPHFVVQEYLDKTGTSGLMDGKLIEFYNMDWALNAILGNFESILHKKQAKTSLSEYVEEIVGYLDDWV